MTDRTPILAAAALCAVLAVAHAHPPSGPQARADPKGPQAGARSNAQNFRDMVLATCIAQAYKDQPSAAADAGSSVSALRCTTWTRRPTQSGLW